MSAVKTVLLATEKPFAAEAVKAIEAVLVEAKYELVKLEKYTEKQALLDAVKACDAAIIRSDKFTKEVLEAGGDRLKLVVRAGAGVDNIDLEAASALKISAMNTPGQNSNAVAEMAFGMMVSVCRNHYDGTSGTELRGKTLGLHGCGNVSIYMIKLAQGFGMEVVAFDPFLSPEQIKERGATPASSVADLFKCHFVSLHIPATPETKKSITKELLLSMPKNGTLINTARKEVVDEEGLLAAMKERADLRYLADVVPDNMTALNDTLGEAAKKRLLVTPAKMGAQTAEANNNAGIAAANQIVAFFEKGDAKFQVNKF